MSQAASKKDVQKTRDRILMSMLAQAPFPGWSWDAVEDTALARVLFPGGLSDVLDHFADYADRQMLAALPGAKAWATLKIRQRIRAAVLARLTFLQDYKEAERAALAHWMLPWRKPQAMRILWRTADRIWERAGDTSTDYNRYTKRGLLSGVLAATMMAWLEDDGRIPLHARHSPTAAFLDRRIENVLKLGKVMQFFKQDRAA
ncbi:MAG: COQ9 family protein [Alphaproteobacteria bacterium]|nr:COQ9 family protein [Alphaproteobacteria bacterium]